MFVSVYIFTYFHPLIPPNIPMAGPMLRMGSVQPSPVPRRLWWFSGLPLEFGTNFCHIKRSQKFLSFDSWKSDIEMSCEGIRNRHNHFQMSVLSSTAAWLGDWKLWELFGTHLAMLTGCYSTTSSIFWKHQMQAWTHGSTSSFIIEKGEIWG